MKPLKMQPTFTMDVPLTADETVTKIRSAINSPELRGHAVSAGRCIEFKVERDQQRFWSPHLSVQVYDQDESDVDPGRPTSQLYCRFAPRPEVWTLFMFLYFFAAFGMASAAVYGCVQWVLGDAPWALLCLPAGLIVIVLLHVGSLVGQGLSSDQMEVLRERFDKAIEIALKGDAS